MQRTNPCFSVTTNTVAQTNVFTKEEVMPRRQLLTKMEKEALLAIPSDESGLIRLTTFSEHDLSLIKRHRGESNRLGFALQLCYLKYPGCVLEKGAEPDPALLLRVSKNLKTKPDQWLFYAERSATRWEHLQELYDYLAIRPFTQDDDQAVIDTLTELATRTDKGIELAKAMIFWLRQNNIIVPSMSVIERTCTTALTQGKRQVYALLNDALSRQQRRALDGLLELHESSHMTELVWLRQPPLKTNAKHILLHIERLKILECLALPNSIDRLIHQNRLLKLAREGKQMTSKDLSKLEAARRYATLVAIAVEARATVIDQIIDLHDRIISKLFSNAKRTQADKLQQSSKTIHAKLRQFHQVGLALIKAKQAGQNPYEAIEQILPWNQFEASVNETQLLAKREDFDSLYLVSDGYRALRKYAPAMLSILQMKAAPSASGILTAINILRQMNEQQSRKVPETAPTDFIPKRWRKLIFTDEGIDRRYYEICVLTELKGALRSGDIWVTGSRQFKDFDDYMVPMPHFKNLQATNALPVSINIQSHDYLEQRLTLLSEQLEVVNDLAITDKLPDASITEVGLRVSPLKKVVPDEAAALSTQVSGLLPSIKITDLLMEVDSWTGFTRHFTHLKTDNEVKDKTLLLTSILADGINLGLSKMAESCPGTTYSKLAWLQAWHVRDETYSSALSELINAQSQHPFAKNWGDGTTSSSDGQNFKVGARGDFAGRVNLKYGQKPGVQFYTHISDQYGPYHVQNISTAIRDSTHVLDGLLYHESDLRIEEHYTDTAGFTDHVFALTHLLGFRFAPRIRDLHDKRLFIPPGESSHSALSALIGSKLDIKLIQTYWDEILRLATSIKQGTVTASLMLRKLGSYPRKNGLALALRELGRIERTLFMLEWVQSTELRRRVQAGLNKGEARNALARAVFFNRLGEIRDRSFEQQRYRASGLNLVTAAIVLWNTTYLERAVQTLKEQDTDINEDLLQHISPLGWDHIILTGEYRWPRA